jgi:protein TonB
MKSLSIITFCLFVALNGFSQEKKDTANATTIDTTAFVKVDVESTFKGGTAAFANYLNDFLYYPREAAKKNIQGIVVVQFVVDETGKVKEVQAISGPAELREEAERVMRKSPRWIPAQKDGKPLKTFKKQPIVFRLS